MVTTILQALNAYTIKMAQSIRTQYFFDSLKTLARCNKNVDSARRDFYNGKMTYQAIQLKFGEELIRKSSANSLSKCFEKAKLLLSQDKSLPLCCVCLDARANYYVIHGQSAHKCVCAVCAMKVALNPSPRCPVTREKIVLLIRAAERFYDCVCGEKKICERVLIVQQESGKKFCAIVECYLCCVESINATFCRTYLLFDWVFRYFLFALSSSFCLRYFMIKKK